MTKQQIEEDIIDWSYPFCGDPESYTWSEADKELLQEALGKVFGWNSGDTYGQAR